jgi:hypothetical protein
MIALMTLTQVRRDPARGRYRLLSSGVARNAHPARREGPRRFGWQDRIINIDELPQSFPDNKNVGVILGTRSQELADVDLDCSEALELADVYLPTTGAEFGRASKPRSHRLYISPGAQFKAFADPVSDGKNTLVELRADGPEGGAHQTLFPPSVADGEQRQWHSEIIAPALFDGRQLTAESRVMRRVGSR